MIQANIIMRFNRVAKCHGYDGYIRLEILAGWGKSLGEHARLAYKGQHDADQAKQAPNGSQEVSRHQERLCFVPRKALKGKGDGIDQQRHKHNPRRWRSQEGGSGYKQEASREAPIVR